MTDEELRLMAMAAKAKKAKMAMQDPGPQNPDGTYGQPPEGMFFDPRTQQWTSKELIQNDLRMREGTPSGRTSTDAEVSGAFAGQTANWGDEALGALTDIPTEAIRATQDYDRQQHPLSYGLGELGGAALSAIPSAKLATGKTLGGTVARGLGIGAGEGAIWGAGRGDEEGRIAPAITDAVIGSATGAITPVALSSARRIFDPIVAALSSKPSNRKVAGTIRQMEGRSKTPVKEAVRKVQEAAADDQSMYVLGDAFGDAGQRKVNAVARQPGEGSAEIRKFLEDRQLGQPERVQRFSEEAYGNKKATGRDLLLRTPDVVEEAAPASGTAKRRADVLKQNRDLAAEAQYAAAREGAEAVDVRGPLGIIDEYIAPLKDVDIKDNNLAGTLSDFRKRLAVDAKNLPEGVDAMELSNFDRILRVKQDVQQARMAAKGYDKKKLGELERALDAALEGASDKYRLANDSFSRASGNIEAIETGREMALRGRPEDNVAEYNRMTPAQQAAARTGYVDRMIENNLRGTAPTADRSKPFRSPKVAQERAAMVNDGGLFDRRIQREGEMWKTQNRALGNSTTADNMADMADMNAGRRLLSAGSDLAHGRIGSAAGKAVDAVSPYLAGENEATRTQIARLLMSKDPEEAIKKALREDMLSRQKSGIIDALARRLAFTGSSAVNQ